MTSKPAALSLRLYVLGSDAAALRIAERLREILSRHCAGAYSLQVIDILKEPALAEQDKILAAPTLVRLHPAPSRRIIGDLSASDEVLRGLDLMPRTEDGP